MKLSGLFFLAVLFFITPELFCDSKTFFAAGVQFEITPDDYASRQAFFSKVDGIVGSLCEASSRPEIIVFPEYIGVFYQLIRYNRIISLHSSFQSALQEVLAQNPQFKTLRDLFLGGESDVESYLSGWSDIAARHEVAIIAGSCFAVDDDGGLKNRSYVFNSKGNIIYSQAKVFLTDFESEIVGLDAGDIDDASFFKIAGKNLVMTICRDAYSREWEQKNSGAFLWIDIKANGEAFDIEQRQSFLRALPSRLFYSDVNYGMTVCAVGHYLDLFWEGQSSAVRKNSESLFLAASAASCDQEDTVVFKIPREQ